MHEALDPPSARQTFAVNTSRHDGHTARPSPFPSYACLHTYKHKHTHTHTQTQTHTHIVHPPLACLMLYTTVDCFKSKTVNVVLLLSSGHLRVASRDESPPPLFFGIRPLLALSKRHEANLTKREGRCGGPAHPPTRPFPPSATEPKRCPSRHATDSTSKTQEHGDVLLSGFRLRSRGSSRSLPFT